MYINGGDHSPFDNISTTFLSELSDARFINSQNLGQQNSSWKSVKSVCLSFFLSTQDLLVICVHHLIFPWFFCYKFFN